MRIGIDTRSVYGDSTGRGGVANYTYNLIKNLAKIDVENEYFLYCGVFCPKNLIDLISRQENFNYKVIGIPRMIYKTLFPETIAGQAVVPRIGIPKTVAQEVALSLFDIFWNRLYLPLEAQIREFDLFHSPNFLLPSLRLTKCIATIHDLSFMYCSQWMEKRTFRTFNKRIHHVVGRASKIITDSNFSKKEIMRLLRVPEEKIKITYLAADEIFRPITNLEKLDNVMEKYDIRSRFLLYTGAIQPRKNLERLIKAYYRLENDGLTGYKLVFAGSIRPQYIEIFKLIDKLALSRDILVLGYVPLEDLLLLYNAADLFIFPSLYEGFGLPVVEAMACGIPVVSSNTSSLPEVVRDAALLVDPYDVDEIAEAMYKVLNDAELRETMRRKGLDRAKMFSWEKTARETLAVYKEVAGD